MSHAEYDVHTMRVSSLLKHSVYIVFYRAKPATEMKRKRNRSARLMSANRRRSKKHTGSKSTCVHLLLEYSLLQLLKGSLLYFVVDSQELIPTGNGAFLPYTCLLGIQQKASHHH